MSSRNNQEDIERSERNGNDLYQQIMRYQKHGRVNDKQRIRQALNNIFLAIDKTYGMFKDTLLTAALNAGLQEVSLELAKRGSRANIKHINQEGDYALLLACKHKYKDVALELLKHPGNPCSPNYNGETPLLLAVSDEDMGDVVKKIVNKGICNTIKNEMLRILEIGNFKAFEELLNSPELELESYEYKLDTTTNLTLLEYIYVTQFTADYSENHKYARALLEKTKIRCNPLHINKTKKISALLFVVGDTGKNIDDCIYVIKKILDFAEEEGNINYVDFKGYHGFSAFDLIFQNALEEGTKIDVRVLKLFIDFYYKNNRDSKVFLRNIPYMCNEPELFKALKKIYPESVKNLLDNACADVIETQAALVNPVVKTPTPEIQMAKRVSRKRKEPDEHLEDAEEIPIVTAISPVSPLPLWAQVGDPLERGIRVAKRYSPTRGGRKTRKNKKN